MGKFEILKAGTSFLWKAPKTPLKPENLRYLPNGGEKFSAMLDEFVQGSDTAKAATNTIQQAENKAKKISDFDKEMFHAYTQMKRIEYPVTKAEIEYLSKFEGDKFINETVDMILGKLKIPKSLKPATIEYPMNEEVCMAYSYSTNNLLLNPNYNFTSKAEMFGFISHELRHMTQNFDVLRTEGLGEKAVRALARKIAKEQVNVIKQTVKKYSLEEYKKFAPSEEAVQEFQYLKDLKKTDPEKYEQNMVECFKYFEQSSTQTLEELKQNIIKELGELKADSEQGNRAKKYLKSILTNYLKKDGTTDASKYSFLVSEREALNLGFLNEEKFKTKGDEKICFIKFLKNYKPKRSENEARNQEIEKELEQGREGIRKMGFLNYLKYLYG